jgi:anaerobic ribonucleoside-triphosphate reductase
MNVNNDLEMRYKELCERCNIDYQPTENNDSELSQNENNIYGEGIGFQRLRRITGYLVGDVSRWNNGKKAELNDREHHTYQEE